MSAFEYKRIELRTEKDFKAAEKLHAEGFKVIQAGIFTVLMERKRPGYNPSQWEPVAGS